jgi:hypothetical protein
VVRTYTKRLNDHGSNYDARTVEGTHTKVRPSFGGKLGILAAIFNILQVLAD